MTDLKERVNSGRELECRDNSRCRQRPTHTRSLVGQVCGCPLRGEWVCTECRDRTCLVIREECRCLCGHRLKEHTDIRKKPVGTASDAHYSKDSLRYKCVHPKCKCNDFSYIVGEGAWILRCRCKHKHTEHDAVSFKCTKLQCTCTKFDSPWVCNCNHPWSAHVQRMRLQTRQADAVSSFEDFSAVAQEVNNLEGIRRDPAQMMAADMKLPVVHREQDTKHNSVTTYRLPRRDSL